MNYQFLQICEKEEDRLDCLTFVSSFDYTSKYETKVYRCVYDVFQKSPNHNGFLIHYNFEPLCMNDVSDFFIDKIRWKAPYSRKDDGCFFKFSSDEQRHLVVRFGKGYLYFSVLCPIENRDTGRIIYIGHRFDFETGLNHEETEYIIKFFLMKTPIIPELLEVDRKIKYLKFGILKRSYKITARENPYFDASVQNTADLLKI